MFVWSKKLVTALLAAFVLFLGVFFFFHGTNENVSGLTLHAGRWMALNYAGLIIWLFVWMIDQARVRGKNVWLWLVPFLVAPLPTLMLFVLFLQRRLVP
jgi:hypothetical protein